MAAVHYPAKEAASSLGKHIGLPFVPLRSHGRVAPLWPWIVSRCLAALARWVGNQYYSSPYPYYRSLGVEYKKVAPYSPACSL
jgi:hypothetical protein